MGLPGVAAGAAVGSSLLGGASANRAAGAQSALDAEKFDLTLKNANASLAVQSTAVRTRQSAEQAALVEEIQTFALEGIRRKGGAAAGSAEGNVAGRTLAETQLDIDRSVSVARARADVLNEFRSAGAEQELRALLVQAEGRAVSAIPSAVTGPSGLEIGLSAISSGFAAASLFI